MNRGPYEIEDNQELKEKVRRLSEIKDEIKDLINEALDLLDGTDEKDTAYSYWYAHILGALDKENDFLGGSMTNMQDTIDALEEEAKYVPSPEEKTMNRF